MYLHFQLSLSVLTGVTGGYFSLRTGLGKQVSNNTFSFFLLNKPAPEKTPIQQNKLGCKFPLRTLLLVLILNMMKQVAGGLQKLKIK